MNDLKALDDLGTVLDPTTGAPPDELRRRVMVGLRGQPDVTRRPVLRLGGRLAVAGGLAVAVTAGVVALKPAGDGTQPSIVVSPDAMTELSAKEILHRAALAVSDDPVPRPDQFVYIDSLNVYGSTDMDKDGKVREHPPVPVKRQDWYSVDGTHDGLTRSQTQGGPVREIPREGCRNGRPTMTVYVDGVMEERSCQPRTAYLSDAPDDPDAMLKYLYDKATGDLPRDYLAFKMATGLLLNSLLPPRSNAALFEAIGRIPGVTAVGELTDSAGRKGIGVGLEYEADRYELIFDPKNYDFLGRRQISLDGSRPEQGTTRLRSGIVDRVGQLP